MLLPPTEGWALLAAVVSLVAWGSWTNFLVATKGRIRFECYYLDYSLAALVTSATCAATLGMTPGDGALGSLQTWPDDFSGIAPLKYLAALFAGVLFNASNIMLCKGIAMVGLALAFPLCIGTAMVEGVTLTYLVDPSGDPWLLFSGVFVALCAVCTAAGMQHLKEQQQKSQPARDVVVEMGEGSFDAVGEASEKPQQLQEPAVELLPSSEAVEAGPSMARKLSICILGGVIMGFWPCLSTFAVQDPGLTPYGELLFYTFAAFLSSLVLLPLAVVFPLEGTEGGPLSNALRDYLCAPMACHLCGWLGGVVWSTGTLGNALATASGKVNGAAALAIGQCANVAAIFWGIFLFDEFKGTDRKVKVLIGTVLALYAGAITLVSLAS
eukprot:784467-Amphidinium_carterae.1